MKGFRERRILPARVVLVRALVAVTVSRAGKTVLRKSDRRPPRDSTGKGAEPNEVNR
jgi:hypothetical protein